MAKKTTTRDGDVYGLTLTDLEQAADAARRGMVAVCTAGSAPRHLTVAEARAEKRAENRGNNPAPRFDPATLFVVSGEGSGPGQIRLYLGPLTRAGLQAALDAERAGGNRWAWLATPAGLDGTADEARMHVEDPVVRRLVKRGAA